MPIAKIAAGAGFMLYLGCCLFTAAAQEQAPANLGIGVTPNATGAQASSNPAVANNEAVEHDRRVSAEIKQQHQIGRNVVNAEAWREKGERDMNSGHEREALLDFRYAEEAMGMYAQSAAMGARPAAVSGGATANAMSAPSILPQAHPGKSSEDTTKP